ncbi:MAG: LON peptidase substrate-binding domain-containing protein [Deltaproteobacteria bacterium]|nr:LON peptidase substrate-binding domain-containing protein [Deltaproteobacteria bacterium]
MTSFPEQIRIFPLSEVVLFPETMLPLHIFEPRYRELLADALAGDRTIGMVLIKDAEADPLPSVYAVGCAGTIIEHKPFTDGRSLVVLKGTVKFRIRRELDLGKLYRVVEAQALYEGPPPMDQVRSWRNDLREGLRELVKASAGEEGMVERLFDKLDLLAMTNSLCASLPLDVLEKQSLLECPTIERRERLLCELLRFKALEARLGIDGSREADT